MACVRSAVQPSICAQCVGRRGRGGVGWVRVGGGRGGGGGGGAGWGCGVGAMLWRSLFSTVFTRARGTTRRSSASEGEPITNCGPSIGPCESGSNENGCFRKVGLAWQSPHLANARVGSGGQQRRCHSASGGAGSPHGVLPCVRRARHSNLCVAARLTPRRQRGTLIISSWYVNAFGANRMPTRFAPVQRLSRAHLAGGCGRRPPA